MLITGNINSATIDDDNINQYLIMITVIIWNEFVNDVYRLLWCIHKKIIASIQMKAAREKLGRPCDMCNNYEAQLQQIQDGEKKASSQVRTLERQLEVERQAMKNQEKYSGELEEKLKNYTEDAEQEVELINWFMSSRLDYELYSDTMY